MRDHYRQLLLDYPLIDLLEADSESAFTGIRATRSRMGQFRSLNDRLEQMKPGDQINLLKITTRDSLPGVQSARLFRADLGFIVSINHGDDIFERHHHGKMSKDDLVEYLTQIREEIDRVIESREKGDLVRPVRQVKVTKAAAEGKAEIE